MAELAEKLLDAPDASDTVTRLVARWVGDVQRYGQV